jgi:DNA-binding IclR family transcriptional regulator
MGIKMNSPALEKGLEILGLINRYPEGLRFTQIIEALNIPTSSAARLLNTLEAKGFIVQVGERGKYRLGEQSLALGATPDLSKRLTQVAQEYLDEFLHTQGKTAVLFIYAGDHTRCLAKACSEYTLRMQTVGEERYDLLIHPWGIVFYSEAEAEEREALWRATGEKFYSTRPVKAEVEKTAGFFLEEGFASDVLRDNVQRVSVPVRSGGKIVAAVASGWFSENLDMAENRRIAKALLEIAGKIEAKI